MPARTTLQHTLVAALAAGTLAASPALAKPVDHVDPPTSSLAGTTSPRQDLRGEHAKGPARAAEAVPAAETGSDDGVWLVLGIGLAAGGIVAGSAAGVARHHRVRARRVAA